MIPSLTPRHARMYIHQPATVFAAMVNDATPVTYPVSTIAYDHVTVGAYTDIKVGMTVLFGTEPGKSDLGRQRINDDATSIAIFFGYSSRGRRDGELEIVDNAYITVLDLRLIWAKIPFVDAAGEMFMDGGVEMVDHNEFPPPIAVMSAGGCGTADSVTGLMTIAFNGQPSYAVADGATITGYLWFIDDGTLTTGALTDDNISFTVPVGFRYISLTVTDSNGKSHTSWRPVFADDPAARISTDKFKITNRVITDQGQAITVNLFQALSRDTCPNGTLVMIWDQEQAANLDRDHIVFIGWHQSEGHSLKAEETGFIKDLTFNLVDAGGRLATLPGFPRILQDEILRGPEEQPETTWAFMPLPTIDKFFHFLGFWHSTLFENVDVILSNTWLDYPFVQMQASGGNLWGQLSRVAQTLVPDHRLVVSVSGVMKVLPDQMLLDEAERSVTTLVELFEDDWSEVSFTYNHHPDSHVLWGDAMLTATEYEVVDDDLVITSVRSIAPGATFGQGVSEATHMQQLTQSQAALNKVTGHRYARINAPYKPMTIRVPGEIVRNEFNFVDDGWVILHCDPAYASLRGFDSTILRGRPLSVTINYGNAETGETIDAVVTMELETSGPPAYTWQPGVGASPGDGDYTPPTPVPPPLVTVPPPMGLIEGQELVVGVGIDGFLYRTADFQTPDISGGPTWDRVDTGIADTIYSWVVDPFSPGYEPDATSGPINGWIVNDTDIYRVEDCFAVTPSVASVFTFPVATSGAAFHWRSIQASFGAFFAAGVNPWLLCISHYRDTAGHPGTWAVRSLDGGATWSTEVLVSGHCSTETPDRFQPIGVYTSPRTPGLAYTAAFIETKDIPLADGYVSTDWGETWSRMSEEIDDSLGYLPRWGKVYDGGTLYVSGPSPTNIAGINAHEPPTAGGGPGGTTEQTLDWIIAPPANTVRMEVEFVWTGFRKEEGLSSGSAGSFAEKEGIGNTNVTSGDLVVDAELPPPDGNGDAEVHFFGGTTIEWELVTPSEDWPINRDTIISSPPVGGAGTSGSWIDMFVNANAIGTGNSVIFRADFSARVLELEFDDGTIYNPPLPGEGGIQPGHMQAGSIHVPWNDNADESILYWGWNNSIYNRVFRLKRTTGSTIEEVTPLVGPRQYGVNRYSFAIRAHDSNRLLLVASVIGNDDNIGSDDDGHAVFKSTDGGETWSLLVSPVTDASAPDNRPAFEAAWGGDSEQVLYVWGPAGYITYSADQGATLDDRSGNLASFPSSGWVGIAGGPTP